MRGKWTIRRRIGVSLAASALMSVAMLAFANVSPANAGTFSIDATGAAFCSLGQLMANVPGFGYSCDGQIGATFVDAPAGGAADSDRELFQINSPDPALTIVQADALNGSAELEDGYGGGTYWNGGGASWTAGVNENNANSGSISSSYWGIQIVCSDSRGCSASQSDELPPDVAVTGVDLTVAESNGPRLVASGLWDEANTWVWNPAGDAWPLSLGTSDPSGVCGMTYAVGTAVVRSPAQAQNPSVWHQCPDWAWNPSVDLDSFVPSSGQVSFSVQATNAANVASSESETLNVDNIPPTVTIAPQNDSNPGGWAVNHPVNLVVKTTTGPSGVSSVNCSDTVGSSTTPLTLTGDPSTAGSYDATIDGNGAHTVSCVVANNAVDPQGAHDTGTAAEVVDIDEQPPTLTFEPTASSNPSQVVVDTSDSESPVLSGAIEIAPQGSSSFTSLPTTFANGELIATVPDAQLKAGAYTLNASATSQVGNIGTTSEGVTLPLRTRSTEAVSFAKIKDPLIAKLLKERVLVGYHLVKEHKHGKVVTVKKGGHYTTITVIKRVEHCTTRRVRVSKHKWRLKTSCAKPRVRYQRELKVGFGKRTRVYGELTTNQDVPIADQTVTIITIPDNGSREQTVIGTATTNAEGGWSAKVPAGPSRLVEAQYTGDAMLLPVTARGTLSVPARIRIRANVTKLPWNRVVVIRGRLVGGHIPKDGVAMRLLIQLPGRKQPYSPVPFRTTSTGTFSIPWSWGTGSGVAAYPFSVATTGTESDYPYAAARSNAITVEFGVRTPGHHTRQK